MFKVEKIDIEKMVEVIRNAFNNHCNAVPGNGPVAPYNSEKLAYKYDPYKHDTIEIVCTKSAAEEVLIPLLKHIATIGNYGHSFNIEVDPDNKDSYESFSYDGDGSHSIGDIKLNGISFRKD